MMKLTAQERPHVLMWLAAADRADAVGVELLERLRLRDVGEARIRLGQKSVGRLRLLPVGVGPHHGVIVGRDLLHGQRCRDSTPPISPRT